MTYVTALWDIQEDRNICLTILNDFVKKRVFSLRLMGPNIGNSSFCSRKEASSA
jgi:hypothetical protein